MDLQTFNARLTAASDISDGKATSLCEDPDLFKELLAAFPESPIRFVVRNFTSDRKVKVIELMEVPGLGREGSAYIWLADFVELFPELKDWADRQVIPKSTLIPASAFADSGQELANAIGRTLHIGHWYGSGRQEESSWDNYGPFVPQSTQ